MKKAEPSERRLGGISANAFAFPLLIIVIIIHVALVAAVIDVNRSSNELSELMQHSGAYQLDATSLQSNNTVMSETCSNFMQQPVLPDGTTNSGPLETFAGEINSESRGPKVVARFREYDVSDEVRDYVEKASEISETMFVTQIHAISLMNSVYPLPETPELAAIRLMPLTAEELAMTADERVTLAKRMILAKEYASLRSVLAEYTVGCNRTLQQEFSRASDETKQRVDTMRTILWILIFTVIAFLSAAFIMFYLMILKPLRNYSKDISENQMITQTGGITEMRRLVSAFNGLWDNRNKLESILRTAAENDSLTGLPNRYCLERDLIKNDVSGSALTVVMFDINYLKQTNDTKGHIAGDNLILKSASCIRECFGNESSSNCYRIGGDEFIAIMRGCGEDEIKNRLKAFEGALKRENITVSAGYAHTDCADAESFKKLMAQADGKMYEQKRRIHEESDGTQTRKDINGDGNEKEEK